MCHLLVYAVNLLGENIPQTKARTEKALLYPHTHTHTHTKLRKGRGEIFAKLRERHCI